MNESELIEYFLKYNYPETKDLSIHFLTLVVSVLVFSIAFSEKIIDYANTSKINKIILVIAWISLLLAIIMNGIGLTIHTMAGGVAVYQKSIVEVQRLAQEAYKLIIIGGILFITGLLLMTTSGIFNLFKKR